MASFNIKKILHLHSGKEGGAERFFVNLAHAFHEREIEQKFCIRPRRSWRSEIENLGEILEDNNRLISVSRLFTIIRLNRLVQNWRPDVVMAWMPRAVSLIKRWPSTCKVVRLGDFPNNLKHFRYCNLIVGNLPNIITRCEYLGWKGKTAVISNFAREIKPVAVSRKDFDTPQDAFLIAGAGRFVHRKGMDVLINCLSLIPNAFLWMIGDGKEMENLKNLALKLGVDKRVRFIGWVNEPINYIAAADAFGMPSRHEPLGNAVLDAWKAGVPVVSTRSEGPSWYMQDGVDGLLVDIDDELSFANKLKLIGHDKDLSDKLIAGGEQRLKEWFSKDVVTSSYLKEFRKILNSID
jgi:glycosyltransferase involved in cell wall biosynthesis